MSPLRLERDRTESLDCSFNNFESKSVCRQADNTIFGQYVCHASSEVCLLANLDLGAPLHEESSPQLCKEELQERDRSRSLLAILLVYMGIGF